MEGDASDFSLGRNTRMAVGLLLYVSVFELVVLGSGRVLEYGAVTARMVFFFAGLVVALAWAVGRGRLPRLYAGLLTGFVALVATSTLVGLMRNAPLDAIVEDIKPLLYFFSLLFLVLAIDSPTRIRGVANVIRAGALLLAVGYVTILVLLYLKMLPFDVLYSIASHTDEFFFRGQAGFFYKGFLYLGVGFLFYAFRPHPRKGDRLLAALFVVVLALTLTRGLLLSVLVVAGVAVLVRQRESLRALWLASFFSLVGLFAWPQIAQRLGVRPESDALRLADISEVARGTTLPVLLMGRGFGAAIGERTRIEASYIEIFYKQGVPGLLFWGALLVLLVLTYRKAARAGNGAEALPFFLSALFVFVESVTNPFLTNPIGMSMVLVSLVAIKYLATSAQEGVEVAASDAGH